LPSIRVRTDEVIGAVSPLLYGHFTEHLGPIMYDGLWSEKLFGRKFEAPMSARVRRDLAEPWTPFLGRIDKTEFPRGDAPIGRIAAPQAGAHHAQAVLTVPGVDGDERGIAQSDVIVDAGVPYTFRASVRRLGPAGTLRAALRAADGETILAEATFDVPQITSTRFGPDFPHNALWMDDQSWVPIEGTLSSATAEPNGWFTLTFTPDPDENCLWMPADNVGGWHRGVVAALAELPARSLKWPGGCMAEDYDWRYGLGSRDDRYGKVDQAWAAWDENDVGIDEFIHLCRLTGAEPIIGVNGGNGSPEEAAGLVEYCNGSADSEWGAVRAANGHPEPYGVKHFVIGNEQWGYFAVGYVGPEKYAQRYLRIARAMKAADPAITLSAVGFVNHGVGEDGKSFTEIVLDTLKSHDALDLVDMMQIHAYTPEGAFPVTDEESAARKVASAMLFTHILETCSKQIASVPGAEHVQVCLDEWGWGHAGHTGAIFMAAGLNAFHRFGSLVQIGSKAAVINVDGVLERTGNDVRRTSAYSVFKAFNDGYLPQSVHVEVGGEDTERIDVSALADPDSGKVSVFVVNRAPLPTAVDVVVDGYEPTAAVALRAVTMASQDLTGASEVSDMTATLGEVTKVAPLSLTTISIG
jgi:alpha-N-arabinofuranosidase